MRLALFSNTVSPSSETPRDPPGRRGAETNIDAHQLLPFASSCSASRVHRQMYRSGPHKPGVYFRSLPPPIPLPVSTVDCGHLAMIVDRLQPARPQLWCPEAAWLFSPPPPRSSPCALHALCWYAPVDVFSVRGDYSPTAILPCFLPLRARWC